jgi:tetratricopeptide (TPR) repeat protein
MGGAYEAMARTKVVGFPDASKPVYDRPELVERAISSLREAAALFQKVGDASGEWHALFNSGVIYENRGEQDRAVDLYRRALAASGAAGERAKVEGRIACSTRSAGRFPAELNDGIRCTYAAFGSVSLIFDEDEWWGE